MVTVFSFRLAAWACVLLLLLHGTAVVRADPPPDPQCRVFCFRVTDIRCDPSVKDRYHFEFEVLNWSDAYAGGVTLEINHLSSEGVEFAEPLLGGIDTDNRPLIWEDIDEDEEFEYDLGDLEDLLIPNGLLDTVGAQTEDKNGNNRLDNDPIPGNLRRPNEWVVSEQLAKTMTWEAGDNGVPIPFINLVDAADCQPCIKSLPQREDGVPFNKINRKTGDVDPLEWIDNGDNVQDGFVMTLDGLEAGKAVHFNWFLTGAGNVEPERKVLITELNFVALCSDRTGEWIELYNAGNHPVDITGWTLKDNTNNPVTLANKVLQPGEYYLVSGSGNGCDGKLGADQTDMGFRLNNRNKETVTLFDSTGTLIDRVIFTPSELGITRGHTLERRKDPHNEQPIDTDNDSSVDFKQSFRKRGNARSGYEPLVADCHSGRGNVPKGDRIGGINNGNAYGFGLLSLVRLDHGEELPGGAVKGQTGFRQSGTEFFDSVYNVPDDNGSCGTIGMEFTPSKTCEEDKTRNNCKKIKTNGGGEPHFTTWSGERFTYNGECDLVLIRNPSFEDGLGMHVHGRSKEHVGGKHEGSWTDMEVVAVQIGKDVFEARGAGDYWINGALNPQLPGMIGGYQVSKQTLNANNKHIAYVISLGGGKELYIKAFDTIMWVQVNGQEDRAFFGSSGLLGEYGNGEMVARDGKTIIKAPNQYGQEWQVTPAHDPILFHTAEGPQAPLQKCKLPDKRASDATNLLKEPAISHEVAEKACARASPEAKDDCIYDVVNTQNLKLASSY